jgi:hypothetical protein
MDSKNLKEVNWYWWGSSHRKYLDTITKTLQNFRLPTEVLSKWNQLLEKVSSETVSGYDQLTDFQKSIATVSNPKRFASLIKQIKKADTVHYALQNLESKVYESQHIELATLILKRCLDIKLITQSNLNLFKEIMDRTHYIDINDDFVNQLKRIPTAIRLVACYYTNIANVSVEYINEGVKDFDTINYNVGYAYFSNKSEDSRHKLWSATEAINLILKNCPLNVKLKSNSKVSVAYAVNVVLSDMSSAVNARHYYVSSILRNLEAPTEVLEQIISAKKYLTERDVEVATNQLMNSKNKSDDTITPLVTRELTDTQLKFLEQAFESLPRKEVLSWGLVNKVFNLTQQPKLIQTAFSKLKSAQGTVSYQQLIATIQKLQSGRNLFDMTKSNYGGLQTLHNDIDTVVLQLNITKEFEEELKSSLTDLEFEIWKVFHKSISNPARGHLTTS